MTTIYKVRASGDLHPADPLHVSRFYPNIQRRHRRLMQDRQDLILYLASLHATAILNCLTTNKPRGFCEVPLRLMSLRSWVHDYKAVLDHFFEIKRLGYNLGEGEHEVSILIPRDLGTSTLDRRTELEYLVPERPADGVRSKVYIRQQSAKAIRRALADANRADLRPAVDWLLARSEVNFIFVPAGKLQKRDTSVWPVAAVETWPGWLREQLFGSGIDIDSAYTQYLMQQLTTIYADRPHLINFLYPDLVKLIDNKVAWRQELCVDVLGLPFTPDNIDLVKKVCMSLANGSRISPAILSSGVGYSVTADIIVREVGEIALSKLDQIGRRLQLVARQYASAKKAICANQLRLNPTRRNQKEVFDRYFDWERAIRYAIWEAVDQHGIMVHDGIDGVPERYLLDMPALIEKIGVKVTR